MRRYCARCCTQVVIAGGSETALACLEALLLHPRLAFNSLALLAPGGVPVGGVACRFTPERIARQGWGARVAVLDAELAGFNLEEGGPAVVVELARGGQLAADKLVLAMGLQVGGDVCGNGDIWRAAHADGRGFTRLYIERSGCVSISVQLPQTLRTRGRRCHTVLCRALCVSARQPPAPKPAAS